MLSQPLCPNLPELKTFFVVVVVVFLVLSDKFLLAKKKKKNQNLGWAPQHGGQRRHFATTRQARR